MFCGFSKKRTWNLKVNRRRPTQGSSSTQLIGYVWLAIAHSYLEQHQWWNSLSEDAFAIFNRVVSFWNERRDGLRLLYFGHKFLVDLQPPLNLMRKTNSSRQKSSFINQSQIACQSYMINIHWAISPFRVLGQNIDWRNQREVTAEMLTTDQSNG